jgi:anti-sigma B factor antagonist
MGDGAGPLARVVSRSGATTTIAVSGEIDICSAPQLRACLSDCLGDGCAHITLDMSDLTFLDASGLSVVAYFANLMESRGGRLTLQQPPPVVQKVLDIGGLASLVDGTRPDSTIEAL